MTPKLEKPELLDFAGFFHPALHPPGCFDLNLGNIFQFFLRYYFFMGEGGGEKEPYSEDRW